MARRVVLGVETLARAQTLLRGRRVGLITGPTGVDGRLRATVDILAEIYDLRALFACEHGIRGAVQAGGHVESEVDAETGVPVFSLYGASRRMTQQMLDAFDVLVYDIQDVGARFYTYLYTLSYAMQDCARAGKTVVVLDRPNPLGGAMEGTLLDEAFHSFVGEYAMPTRYGLTVGEYARFVRAHYGLSTAGGPVELVGQKQVAHQGSGVVLKAPALLVVYRKSGEVGGHHIRGELHPLTAQAQGLGKGQGHGGLAHAGDVFQQNVAPGQNGQQDPG